jgi:hypothetical protein
VERPAVEDLADCFSTAIARPLAKEKPAESPANAADFQRVPLPSETAMMEAEGIEPSSQDNPDGGLYMLRRCFVVVLRGERRHPSRRIRRVFLAGKPTSKLAGQPVFFDQRFTDVSAVPTLPILLGSDCERGAETDATRDITVIGS